MITAGSSAARPPCVSFCMPARWSPASAADAKLAIVYLGDTLNTAARIEETAKAIDATA